MDKEAIMFILAILSFCEISIYTIINFLQKIFRDIDRGIGKIVYWFDNEFFDGFSIIAILYLLYYFFG